MPICQFEAVYVSNKYKHPQVPENGVGTYESQKMTTKYHTHPRSIRKKILSSCYD